MVTLYQRTDCPFCWKVRLALHEVSVAYKTIDIELGEKNLEIAFLSPTGTVPVLVDGDVVIWESSIMLDYLDTQYAPEQLIPNEVAAQMRIRSLHAYSDKCVGPALRDLVFEKRANSEADWDLELVQRSELKWRACQRALEEELSVGTYFGATFGAADCALATRCGVAQAYGAGVSKDYPNLWRWFEDTKLRSSWDLAYPASFVSK